jgi:Sec-independent protein translocase protein TatA
MGPYEMLVILALGLMLFSPRELPAVLRSIAKFWGSIRRTADEFREAILQDEDLKDLRQAYDGTRRELREAEVQARRELTRARAEMRKAEQKLAEATQAQAKQIAGVVKASDPTAPTASGRPSREGVDPESEGAGAGAPRDLGSGIQTMDAQGPSEDGETAGDRTLPPISRDKQAKARYGAA